jgi:hypothetical protein
VISAIVGGVYGRIAVTYVEWAGPQSQEVVIPWRAVDGQASAEGFAAALTAAPTSHVHGTSISAALAFASTLFDGNGFGGARRAIDISGDGPNNMGPPVTPVRDAVVARGVTINGLPLTLRAGSPWGAPLDLYYEDCVIGGPGAFFLAVQAPEQLAEAIRRKLVLEIAGRAPSLAPAQLARLLPADERDSPRIDCLIGEKMRPSWLDENK